MNDLPWLVIGDFNEAFWNFEHMSATPWAEALMMDFHDTLETCELVDLGFSGAPFSYDNMRSGVGNVKVRLDRAVALASWQNMFAYSDRSRLHAEKGRGRSLGSFVGRSPITSPPSRSLARFTVFFRSPCLLY